MVYVCILTIIKWCVKLNNSRNHQGTVQQFSVDSTRNGNAMYEIDLNVRKDSKGTVET